MFLSVPFSARRGAQEPSRQDITGYASVFRADLFKNRRVIVTGGGLGRCTAHELAHLSANVVIVGRNPDKLETVAGEIRDDGGIVTPLSCDIREEEQVIADSTASQVGVLRSRLGTVMPSGRGAVTSSRSHSTETWTLDGPSPRPVRMAAPGLAWG